MSINCEFSNAITVEALKALNDNESLTVNELMALNESMGLVIDINDGQITGFSFEE